jgi:diacylglycerol kinase (ATP)
MWLVVCNASAGKGKGSILAGDFIKLLSNSGLENKLIDCDTFAETKMLLEKEIQTNRYNYLIAVGGDGLVNLCLQLVAEKPICLGVIPAGTGNDFARATGFNGKSVDEIFSIFSRSKPVKIDLGKAVSADESKWFVQVLSTGFDAIVNSLANKMTWPRGKSKYTIATILILSRFKSIPYMVEIDGRIFEQNAMLLAVANGESYGGGMRICPGASNSDGIFDVLIVRPVTKIVLLTIFPKVFKGNHIPHPKIDVYKGKYIKISSPTVAYADGEFVSHLPLEVTNVPNALTTWLAS